MRCCLKGIYTHIAIKTFEKRTARRIVNRIREKIEQLDTFPKKYSVGKFENMKIEDLHSIAAGNYIIIYKIFEKEKKVTVLRILYGRQDIENMDI